MNGGHRPPFILISLSVGCTYALVQQTKESMFNALIFGAVFNGM